jgi:hypothetical protein
MQNSTKPLFSGLSRPSTLQDRVSSTVNGSGTREKSGTRLTQCRSPDVPSCQAYRCGDEMHCPGCRLRWDCGDPRPPRCRLRDAGDEAVTHGITRPQRAHTNLNLRLTGRF